MEKSGKNFTSAGFEEDEVKLNAPDKKYLNKVWSSILRSPYYSPANSSYLTNGHPDDVNWAAYDTEQPDTPQTTSKWRYRYYFDTPDLALYRQGIELRMQPEKGGAYRQVIKFNTAAADSVVLQRLEFPALVRGFVPDLQAIDKKAEFRENAIEILRETVRGAPLGPKVSIRSQRRKTEYHPNDDKNIMVEGGLDIGMGVNVAGFHWRLCQVELESKKNETADRSTVDILGHEASRLTERFPELVITTTSKPSDGFNDLQTRLTSKKSRKIIQGLPRDCFTITDKLPVLNKS